MFNHREWLKKYIKQIEGRTIVKTGVNRDGFPQLFLDNGVTLEISSDEEGNSAGTIFGLPNVKVDE